MVSDKTKYENNNIGTAIQYYRNKYRISQSELSKGLCSVTTLSRIESGDRDADALLLQILLERLGQNPNKFELIITDADFTLLELRDTIEMQINTKNTQRLNTLINSYEGNIKSVKENIHKQFILKSKAILYDLQGGNKEKTLEMLTKAISYTVPDIRSNYIEDYYLSISEFNIILEIIKLMISLKLSSDVKKLLEKIIKYLNIHYSVELVNEFYPKVAIITCQAFYNEKNFDKALEICNLGLERYKGNRFLDNSGELCLYKAQILESLRKNGTDYNIKKQECLNWYLKAYYILKFRQDIVQANKIMFHIQREYDEQI